MLDKGTYKLPVFNNMPFSNCQWFWKGTYLKDAVSHDQWRVSIFRMSSVPSTRLFYGPLGNYT